MMLPLVLAALLQQAPSVDDRIDAFLKGDASAREHLVKAGPAAIRALRTRRGRDPERIAGLLLDLKRRLADPPIPEADPLGANLEIRCAFRTGKEPLEELIRLLIEQSRCPLPILIDPVISVPGMHSIDSAETSLWRHLDEVSRLAGVDYGFFQGVIVVSTPERLWTEPVAVPKGELAARCAKLLGDLSAEEIARREAAAQELLALGPDAAPFVKAHRAGSPEEGARVERLLGRLKLAPAVRFRRAGLEAQTPDKPRQIAIERVLRTARINLNLENQTLPELLLYLQEFCGLTFDLAAQGPWPALNFRSRCCTLEQLLCLVAPLHRLDFSIVGDRVVIR